MAVLPLFIDLSGGPVLLTGSGGPALAKLALLRARGARVCWYPLEPPGGDAPAADAALTIRTGEPDEAALDGVLALVLASGRDIDAQLSARARRRGVPVNVVDNPELSTYYFPAIADRGEVLVAIGTGGSSPVLARRLRERIEALLPTRIGDLAALIGRWRQSFRARFGVVGSREFWEGFIDGPMGAGVLEGRAGEAETFLSALGAGDVSEPSPLGRVTLVGAGPGDADLLTLKGLQALQNAGVIFHDHGIAPEILNRARRDATRIRLPMEESATGPRRNATLKRVIDAAKTGKPVVWLGAGNPFEAGSRGAEAATLRSAGIAVSVVPGIADPA